MHFEKIAINPLLGKKTWDFADMAVAQDWELERGNEGALIWNSLGPELARMVCENLEVLMLLGGIGVELGTGARVWAGPWARGRAWAWAGKRTLAWALAWEEARSGAGALAKAGENSA